MIAHLKGKLIQKVSDQIIVDVNGVGYEILLSSASFEALPEEGAEISLYIYSHIREDQFTLFGFVTKDEKVIFQRLLNVTGIGPKMALSLLSGLKPKDVVNSIIKSDLARLSSISGIGKKTAERMVVELKDKFVKEFGGGREELSNAVATNRPLYDDAFSAMINLGYPKPVAEKALAKVNLDEHKTVQTVIRKALKEAAIL